MENIGLKRNLMVSSLHNDLMTTATILLEKYDQNQFNGLFKINDTISKQKGSIKQGTNQLTFDNLSKINYI